jgi:hypothetical protein
MAEDRNGLAQRAFVSGLCSEQLSSHLLAAAVSTDIIILATPVRRPSCIQIPVTRLGQNEETWLGAALERDDLLAMHRGELHEDVLGGLLDLWSVQAFDPVWGRDELLWEVLLRGVRERPLRHLPAWIAKDVPGSVGFDA